MKADKQKNVNATKPTSTRYVQTLIGAAAISVLAACGGGGGGGGGGGTSASTSSSSNTQASALQVVSFGDELSDVGTYAPVILADFGGGRYTTNPGEVWTQKVAEYFGGSLSPAFLGGFGQQLSPSNGLGYAQGGARVQDVDGEGHAPLGSANADYAQATTVPIAQQVQNYLSAHGSFNANQLVLINGGTDDILKSEPAIAAAIAADVAGGMDPSTATQKEASTTLGPVAQAFASTVQQIVTAGAGHVAVVNVPDLGQTPLGVQNGSSAQQLLTALASAYNQAVAQKVQSFGFAPGKVVPIDLSSWQDSIVSAYQANGFSVSTNGTGCNLALMVQRATSAGVSNPQGYGSALFCSPQMYTAPGVDQSYMFADLTNPSSKLHALFAQYVEQQLASAGISR